MLAAAALAACSGGGKPQAPPSSAKSPAREYGVTALEAPYPGLPRPGGAYSYGWGERMRGSPDLNGDGVADLVVGNPGFAGAFQDEGQAFVVSGKDRKILYRIAAPSPSENAGFGTYLAVFEGPTGPAVAVGAGRELVAGNRAQGRVYVFRLGSAAAEPLYTLDIPEPEPDARFGERIGLAGDVGGSGSVDLVVAAAGHDVPTGCAASAERGADCRPNVGRAYLFDGANGALIRVLDMPAADVGVAATCSEVGSCGSFGSAVQSPGDVNGDGKGDQLVSAYGFDSGTGSGSGCGQPEPNGCNEKQGRQYLFSGADGALLATIDDPEPQEGASFGFQDVAPDSPGDVNGDGTPDLYANGFEQKGPAGLDQGGAWVFDGRKTLEAKAGVVLYKVTDPRPSAGGQFGWSMATTDFEPDGHPDLLVGSSPHHLMPDGGAPWPDQAGHAAVLKGADGTPLQRLDLPPAFGDKGSDGNLGANLGWSVAAPGDLNGDGKPDYVAGAPYADVGDVQDQGRVAVFLSR